MITEAAAAIMVVVGSKILVAETTATTITTGVAAEAVAAIDLAVADKVMDKVVATTEVVGLKNATSFISNYK
jgi:hypothetical protein